MRRFSLRELHERRSCPAILRDGLTDFLSFFAIYSGVYDSALELLKRRKPETIVDNCAGGGLYAVHFARKLGVKRYFLTDLYPNRNWPEVAAFLPGVIEPVMRSLEVKESIRELNGVHIMFSALHHFSEEELAAVLQAGAEAGRTLFFFDYSQRRLWIEVPALLGGVLLFYCTAFLVWPFSWKRLLFTYVIPLLPLLFLADGLISRLRAYRLDELERVVEKLELPPGCKANCGVLRKKIIAVHWISVEPELYSQTGGSEK